MFLSINLIRKRTCDYYAEQQRVDSLFRSKVCKCSSDLRKDCGDESIIPHSLLLDSVSGDRFLWICRPRKLEVKYSLCELCERSSPNCVCPSSECLVNDFPMFLFCEYPLTFIVDSRESSLFPTLATLLLSTRIVCGDRCCPLWNGRIRLSPRSDQVAVCDF